MAFWHCRAACESHLPCRRFRTCPRLDLRRGRSQSAWHENVNASRLPSLLRLSGERRKKEADSENDREPDPPHGHPGGGWLAGVYLNAAATCTSRPSFASGIVCGDEASPKHPRVLSGGRRSRGEHRVARACHPARAALAARFAACSGGRGLLGSGAVLLGDGVQALRPVHHAHRVGPAIELAHARSRRPTRGGSA